MTHPPEVDKRIGSPAESRRLIVQPGTAMVAAGTRSTSSRDRCAGSSPPTAWPGRKSRRADRWPGPADPADAARDRRRQSARPALTGPAPARDLADHGIVSTAVAVFGPADYLHIDYPIRLQVAPLALLAFGNTTADGPGPAFPADSSITGSPDSARVRAGSGSLCSPSVSGLSGEISGFFGAVAMTPAVLWVTAAGRPALAGHVPAGFPAAGPPAPPA
jgi:hypothetical protein